MRLYEYGYIVNNNTKKIIKIALCFPPSPTIVYKLFPQTSSPMVGAIILMIPGLVCLRFLIFV